MKINKEVKEKWVAALRSGEYTQCRGSFQRDNTYCVIGVLLDIYRKEKQHTDLAWDGELKNWAGLPTFCTYPFHVVHRTEWLGLVKERESLMYLNDIEGLSFKELADLIEKSL